MRKEIISLVVFFLMMNAVFSQEKFEREYRITSESVPENAKLFVDKFNFDKKVKWFAEESQDGKTIEAKSCLNNYKYSIEFSENGNLIDVEKEVNFKELPEKNQQKINSSLTEKYDTYKIKKLQIQYKGNQEVVLQSILNNTEVEEIIINYELVVKGKKENESKRYELLVDERGTILKELIFKNSFSINLEF